MDCCFPRRPSDETSAARVKVIAADRAENADEDASNDDFTLECLVAVETDVQAVTRYALHASRPNPFRSLTTMRFAIVEDTPVELVVLDVHGRRVRTLVDRSLSGPSQYDATWDGRDDSGRTMGSGVYFYRLKTRDFSQTRRLTLLR